MNDPTVLTLLALRATLETAIAARDAARTAWTSAKHAATRAEDDLATALVAAVEAHTVKVGQAYRVNGVVVVIGKAGKGKYHLTVAAAPDGDPD